MITEVPLNVQDLSYEALQKLRDELVTDKMAVEGQLTQLPIGKGIRLTPEQLERRGKVLYALNLANRRLHRVKSAMTGKRPAPPEHTGIRKVKNKALAKPVCDLVRALRSYDFTNDVVIQRAVQEIEEILEDV